MLLMNLILQLLNGHVDAKALLFAWGVQIIVIGIAIENRSQAGSN